MTELLPTLNERQCPLDFMALHCVYIWTALIKYLQRPVTIGMKYGVALQDGNAIKNARLYS
ncbi:hypothetical protein CRM82_03520 [Comamonas terrigena]|uniref:Uncharacterized protein n=1 Tax=Comamonas terrigena TaxID=32013 RepID=A0A2A7URB0_COMTR|nr:hypothetical protein [Comamonas terrigena]PEH87802.1 hypothetical protein CRM82_03520 [Comamonas terrigena]